MSDARYIVVELRESNSWVAHSARLSLMRIAVDSGTSRRSFGAGNRRSGWVSADAF